MADALYTRAAATAARMLAKYGKPITLRTTTAGTYDTATATTVPVTADVTRNGALFDFGAGQTTERGNLVQAGDKRLYLEPATAPTMHDHIVDGANEYTIVSIGEINPAGTPILYDLHIRK